MQGDKKVLEHSPPPLYLLRVWVGNSRLNPGIDYLVSKCDSRVECAPLAPLGEKDTIIMCY